MAEGSKSDDKTLTEESQNDEELDSLLDSALDDFTNLEKPKPVEKKAEASPSSEVKDEDAAERMWADMIKQAMNIDPAIKDMLQQGGSEENKFAEDFSRMAEAAAKALEGQNSGNFADIMTETLKNLNEASQSIQSQFGSPEELAGMFQELGLGAAGANPQSDGSIDDLPPFMQNIMQSFLSKDILYPAVKEFVDKYPKWLEDNKATLPAEQFDNYTKQFGIMKALVNEFESEQEGDSEDVKKQRFHKIMELLQQMQLLGQPPAELIGGNSENPIDEAAMANFIPPGMDPNQCSLM